MEQFGLFTKAKTINEANYTTSSVYINFISRMKFSTSLEKKYHDDTMIKSEVDEPMICILLYRYNSHNKGSKKWAI